MRDIHPDTLKLFSEMLKRRSVPSGLHSYYIKWLRYYLDFCSKYNLSNKSSKSLTRFILKLKEKKQTDVQQKQAGHAVSLFLDMEKTAACGEKKPPSVPAEHKLQMDTFKQYSATGASKTQWQKAIAEMTAVIKTKHYSPKTLRSYRHWAWKLQTFRKTVDPALLGTEDVKAFLSWLAVSCKVSASSQNQAFNAILFFFRHVLKKDFGEIRDAVRAKRKPYIPVVLSRDEVSSVIKHLYPPYDLIVKTLYGCGLRLFECIKLRVHNFNFDAGILTIHDGKGQKDRTVPLPKTIIPDLFAHLERLKKTS